MLSTKKRRAAVATTASAIAVALAAGLGGGAAAAPPGSDGNATTSAPTPRGAITLLTGDKVVLAADGSVAAIHPAPGREDIPVRVIEHDGTTLVLPRDAVALIAEGTVDRSLFDIGELSRPQYERFAGTPLIVGYEDGTSTARSELRAEPDVELRSALDIVDADAVTHSEEGDASVWETLTEAGAADRSLAAAPGITGVSLDRIVRSSLDTSTAQVGAPAAWAEGLDGTGTTIAVLDTGISADHGDFEDKVKLAENFTDAADTDDPFGHGTHVASIAAGTGARSDGTYRGVAPGADLLNGKVLNDDGSGMESWIIEGMEWAADSGADVINMSLGAPASLGPDPMADAVDRISAETDVLFVIAAGNSGPSNGTIDSPGVADAALTVGSVTKDDEISEFSGIGPRITGGALKPEITAPGSDIGAAVVEGSYVDLVGTPVADGYAAIDGTSMAAPHVAGAAAILAQARPDWTGAQLKTALTSATAALDGPAPIEQGTGRLDVERAISQTVTADTTTLDFGAVEYPSEQADPVTRELTYRNAGDTHITLDLALTTTGPDGTAPDGMFTAAEETLTVPAGGEASVEVTATPGVAGGETGHYGVFVTATGDDQQVRAAGTIELEPELFDLTLDITGRDGEPAPFSSVIGVDLTTGQFFWSLAEDGVVQQRVTEGEYVVEAYADHESDGEWTGLDLALHPGLTVTEDITVEVAFAEARPIDFVAPDGSALDELVGSYSIRHENGQGFESGFFFPGLPEGIGTLSLGEASPAIDLTHAFTTFHPASENSASYLHSAGEGFPTGLVNHASAAEMAEMVVSAGASVPGTLGSVAAGAGDEMAPLGPVVDLPGDVTLQLQAAATDWFVEFAQFKADGDSVAMSVTPPTSLEPGSSHTRTVNVGVFGPLVDDGLGVFLEGGYLLAHVPHFVEPVGRWGAAANEGSGTLYRDGEVLAELDESAEYVAERIPEGEAEYRLVSTADRHDLGYAAVSTEVTVDYTFTAAPSEDFEQITGPLAVRYSPDLALDSTAPAKKKLTVPLTVTGGDAAHLTVEASFDHGETWEQLTVHTKDTGQLVYVHNPAAGGSVSLRATAEDADGNRSIQTIIDAYLTR
ncbi:S8 family serine peptidase [Streptomyces bohaiensis]|uniref:S8 family serine peptidase n=1 Tax=Streptomyces bohaiensis TaxID=1431344 RepID=UPI0030C65FE6